MSESGDRDAGAREGRMRDQDQFREDPRGGQEVSDQQPEVQPSDEGGRDAPRAEDAAGAGGEAGRDDAGEATGNPPNAG